MGLFYLSAMTKALYALAIFLSFTGHVEHQANRSTLIDLFNSHSNVPLGSSYCATSISYILDSAGVDFTRRTAVAQGFITRRSISAEKVLIGAYQPKASDLVIWKRGNTWKGHVGMVRWWNGSRGGTIEANTSPNETGSQANGGGIYQKQRKISPANYFRITHFTPIYRK